MGTDFPHGPEQLTDAWLTEVLCAGGGRVVRHEWTPIGVQGAAAVVVRVALEYASRATGAPGSVVAKFAAPHEPMRLLMHGMGLYHREAEFYRRFGTDAGISIPVCYHAEIDAASGNFVLLLEDMSDSRVGDSFLPLPEDVETAVRQLAPFHARWWSNERLQREDWLRYPGTPGHKVFMEQARGALAGCLPVIEQRFPDEFPPLLSKIAQRSIENWEALVGMQVAAPKTLVHGDFHPQQLFFANGETGRFAVFDWQTVNAGRAADDLARIIATGLTAEQQEAHEARLLETYYSSLLDSGVKGYEWSQLRDELAGGFLTTLIINIIAGATMDLQQFEQRAQEAGVPFAEGLFGRLEAALARHDVLSKLPA